MASPEISFSNRAYGTRWYKNLERQNPRVFAVLEALIEEIGLKDGGDIVKAEFYERRPDAAQLIAELAFDPLPGRGQMFGHNGKGIRHAKFAPSKSVAVVWLKVRDRVYVTFDDHAPIRYHRAIRHLRELALGMQALPKRPRNTGHFLRNLKQYWVRRHFGKLRGFNPRSRFYE